MLLTLDRHMVYNISMEYKSNNNIYYSCKYHVVWCSKYRRKVLSGDIELRLKEVICEAAAEINADILEIEIMPDHVHLLLEVDPQYGIHRAVKHIKGKTSRLMRNEFRSLRSRLPSLWTNSYFVAAVGGAPLSAIKQYIESQKYV